MPAERLFEHFAPHDEVTWRRADDSGQDAVAIADHASPHDKTFGDEMLPCG